MKKSKLALTLGATAALTLSMGVCAMAKNKIIIAGDSTACEYGYDDNYAIPRAGWGMYIDKYLDDAEIENLAKSGRSSKSFTAEDNYTQMLSDLGEGDYLFIQFGHNDQKKSSEEDLNTRYTDPEGDKDTAGSFKNSLYTSYILPAREKGAIPVLLTPITRLKYNEDGSVNDSHTLYDDAIRELAEEEGVICLDMTKATMENYESVGEEKAKVYHAVYKDSEKGANGLDTTHLNHYGAKVIASQTAKLMSEDPELKNLVKTTDIDESVTRIDFVKELVRLGDISYDGELSFTDIENEEDAKAAAAAKSRAIALGVGDDKFEPYRDLKLNEMKLFSQRFALSQELDFDIPEDNSEFAQAPDVYALYQKIYFSKVTKQAAAPQSDDEIEKVE
ncbi:MAG: rhamnogalacturonan acetylesterase [Firmicutes bacterium]|nr:rhamnogalacturonan acetylesterase [Bacillota bacterium]